ncbi:MULTISPECIES: scabin-related ADP-ribosyltransferase [unclassified Dyella]|jgi:hypothetical protein|uniref:scabin-related ADP-ribosyltransferase n=1 Tax=unclassified Dyella TaxID=2634549 RepID=UPI003F90739A
MKKRLVAFLLVCQIGVAGLAFAAPPKFVYRVDTRPPSVIFAEGFRAWGTNHNIVAHINGATCSSDGSTSAFVSTAANFNAARDIANKHLLQRSVTYIYRIRADQTFYSGPASMDWLQQRSGSVSPLSVLSLEMARRADEWDAVDGIPAQNIVETQEVTATGSRSIPNTRYFNVNTQGNANPYTANAADTLQHYGLLLSSPGGRLAFMSACFASCSGSSAKRLSQVAASPTQTCRSGPERVADLDALIVGLSWQASAAGRSDL